jgi:anti-sigma regulatory factor (Ser/Thr protein kinase)
MNHPAIAKASVVVSFPPTQRFVSGLVRWLTDFCVLSSEDTETISRLQMAVNELVENLVKYGNAENVTVEVELDQVDGSSVVRVRTRNTASPERLEHVVRLLTDLRDTPDPIAYYDQLILESAPRAGVSGLGLARIRAEGDLNLDFEVVGQELSVAIETRLTSGIAK